MLNETHDAKLTSWVGSANTTATDFPLQNLPFGVFRRKGSGETFRGGVAIGDRILDLAAARAAGAFAGTAAEAVAACDGATLDALMALPPEQVSALRLQLSRCLRAGAPQAAKLEPCLVAQSEAELGLPATVGDFTDFFVSIYHATNAGRMFRPDNPLMPNYKWVPVAYHSRASSVRPSPQRFVRPSGQSKAPDAAAPVFGPCKRLDFELELGVFIGRGNALGAPVAIAEAEAHAFGLCILNDWSARDIQQWEYQPLGPFLGKSFATTISPWIVTLEALEPYRLAWTREASDPQPLPYLESADNRARGALDVQVEVLLETGQMRGRGAAPVRLARSSYRHAYWTLAQMIAHHTANGCNLTTGDLLGTGTLSGPESDSVCSMLELTQAGREPLKLPGGETRAFLDDGDSVIMRAWCERAGFARIGFGECAGTVLPAR